ncbi:bestrophin family protein [Sphingobacterium rhinopitheci]|uniref:bestrophin family protein n=1 Tax=Sphingobacterium rhinopitheci TaxID=2781960 RepID=UPI001F51E889|nr:bestrophin family protein [Sphingobacterium rhinopitheci]MCI0922079.1 bestrophin family protein [Sphingobacterium rhinopitheci]
MKVYNPKDWVNSLKYLYRSDQLKRVVPLVILVAFFTWIIAFIELEYLQLSNKSSLSNFTVVHSLLGFVLSLILVFRTNTAYDRWWEGRKQWGTLTNVSRTLSYKVNAMLDTEDKINRSFYRKAIPLFAETLYNHLRSDYTKFMLDEERHPELSSLDDKKHGPNQVTALIYKKTINLYNEGIISGDELRILNDEITAMTNVCGACERIKNTPIPIAYSSFIKIFIILYSATLPIGYVFSMGYLVVLAVPFIFYVLITIELIGESIEEPFGKDTDDLPIDKIASNIKKHCFEVLNA